MDRYLEQHFKGKYRVIAHYDGATNDWIRDYNGNLDESFGDFYIKCRKNIEIKHGCGSILSCYIPSKGTGLNILRKIYTDHINSKMDASQLTKDKLETQYIPEMIDKKILDSAEILDDEVYFTFDVKYIDYIAELVGASKTGANKSPFAQSNLPKAHYDIPAEDMKIYNDLLDTLPKAERKIGNNVFETYDSLWVFQITKQFDNYIDQIFKKTDKEFNVKNDRAKSCLKHINYIHMKGLWQDYIEYLQEEIKNKYSN